jgi:hypothetical protein
MVLMAGLLAVALALSIAAASEPKHVLLLHSFDGSFEVFAKTFRTELARQSTAPTDLLDVWLQPRLSENSHNRL